MRPSWRRGVALAIAIPFLTNISARPGSPARPAELPGGRPDGSVLLPNGWSLHPVGDQITLGDFPVNIALHPNGRYAAILHAGYGQHEVRVVDLQQRRVISRAPLELTFYGITFSADGRRLFCSGAAGAEQVRRSHQRVPVEVRARGDESGFGALPRRATMA